MKRPPKVQQVVALLTSAESRKFVRWVKSQGFHQPETLIRLFETIRRGVAQDAELEAQLGRIPTTNKSWRTRKNELLQALKRFLSSEQLRKETALSHWLYLRWLKERADRDLLRLELKQKLSNGQAAQDPFVPFWNLQQAKLLREWDIRHSLTAQESNAQHMQSAFEQWVASEWLTLAPAMYQPNQPTSEFFDALADVMFQAPHSFPSPQDRLQLTLVQIARSPLSASMDTLQSAFSTLQTHQQQLERDLQINAFHSLLACCQQRELNQSNEQNRVLMLALYEWAMEHSLLQLGSETPANHLANIVSLCLEQQEVSRGQALLELMHPFIGSQDHHLYQFHQARLWLWQGHFQAILSKIRPREYRWDRFRVPAKLLICQAQYELMEKGEEYYPMEALKELSREMKEQKNQLSPLLYLRYWNHLIWLKRLLTPEANPREIQQMRNELVQTPQVYARNWLLEKMAGY